MAEEKQTLVDLELGNQSANKPVSEIPGLWYSSISDDYCCIYRVPNRLRRVNPEAYTPQMLLIGPIHHSQRLSAVDHSKFDLRYLEIMNMEHHKKKYLNNIADKYGNETIEEFKRIIKEDEKFIRESYAETTDWIKSEEFNEIILHDSIFILTFFINHLESHQNILNLTNDILFHEPCRVNTILEDLILLENQLPYVLLTRLFDPFLTKLKFNKTFRDLTLESFGCKNLKKEVNFRHFTDLIRRVRVETLGVNEDVKDKRLENSIKVLYNADTLDSAGVHFEGIDESEELTLVISFEHGILRMPCFRAEDNAERVMRNIMALEQCHYPYTTFVCDYMIFLDFLIDTEQDVDLLIKKGVVKNWLGDKGEVKGMVNKLCLGLVVNGSHYFDISESLQEHYKSCFKTSIATLRRVYFKDVWTTTATFVATILLLLTLIQTITSILQVKQGASDKQSPPPPK